MEEGDQPVRTGNRWGYQVSPRLIALYTTLILDSLPDSRRWIECARQVPGQRSLFVRAWKISRLQEQRDAVQDLLNPVGREGADLLDQVFFVDREELGDVDDATLRKIRFALI